MSDVPVLRIPVTQRIRIDSVEYIHTGDEIIVSIDVSTLVPKRVPWWARLHRALARLVGGE